MTDPFKIPVELLEQFARGNVLLFVGEGINQDVLPSAAELARELAERCDYPPEEPLTLPRVAGYYELTRHDRQGLVQLLRDRLVRPGLSPSRAHQLVAQLRPPVVVNTCYDRLLARVLQEADVPYTPAVGGPDVAYTEEGKVLLVWLWGVLDDPDSIIVTEDDRRQFLKDRASLSDVLRGELAKRHWLFVGYDAEDVWFRDFYARANQEIHRHRRRAYIYGGAPSSYARAWWAKYNAEVIPAEVEGFLAALVEQRAARARPTPSLRRGPAAAAPAPLPEEPYKALVAYEAGDRALFFGRDREIEELTALVHANPLVLLVGVSGVGKTSLLQAGVLPRLEEADPGYLVVNVRALTDPTVAIRAALRRRLPAAPLPEEDGGALVDFLAAAARAVERPLAVVIDQFEEFFIRLSPEFRADFIAELGALYDARDVPVRVVLSMRGDYLHRVSEIERRIPEIFDIRLSLLPLTREQAREAIVRPVEALGYAYAPDLVARLLDDLTQDGVMPPQLQLVCRALFRHAKREDRRTLTLADYEALGGAQGVLRGYLDEELRRFPPEEQALARNLLEELVTSERTKRAETLAELELALDAEADRLRSVIEKLVHVRLLRPMTRGEGDDARRAYELAHEYLIGEIELESEVVARKEAEDRLRQGMDNWKRLDELLSAEAFAMIDAQRDRLRLSAEAQPLMLCSALRHGRAVGYWLARIEDGEQALALTQEALLVPEGGAACQSLGASATELAPARLNALTTALARAWRAAKGTARACASDALWALRPHLPRPLRLRLALSRSPRLMRRIALPVTGVLIGILAISAWVWGPRVWTPKPEIAWVDIPAGSFIMGSDPEVDESLRGDEQPKHEVVLDAYAITKFEITNAQYARCIEATVCEGDVERVLANPEYADHPVVNVTWFEAQTFCRWVAGRLPTEAEWEYAARGPEGLIYPWGNDFKCARGNFDDETDYDEEVVPGVKGCDGYVETAPVGTFPGGASWCGAHDMAGNVWEWMADWYDANYYSQTPEANPTGPDDGVSRVLRGGSWYDKHAWVLRGAFRNGYNPDGTNGNIGFRCARSSQ